MTRCVVVLAALAVMCGIVRAQQATDTSVQASPVAAPPKVPAVDASAQASPVTPQPGDGPHFAANTAIVLRLDQAIDSGHLRNGQTVPAKLSAAAKTVGGRVVPVGTPVTLSVVATLPAGKISAAGEISLQVLRVGAVNVFTDTQTFRGKPGHRDVADSAPEIGTDAGLPAGAALTFTVQPKATMAAGPPEQGPGAGAVTGRSSGDSPSNAGRPR